MKYVVMFEVYANLIALAKVVDDARSYGGDSFVCFSDIVCYWWQMNGGSKCREPNTDTSF